MINILKEKVLHGDEITREEALLLCRQENKQALYEAAGETGIKWPDGILILVQ